MALTTGSLGDLEHVGLDRLFKAEAKKYPDYSEKILGKVIKTKDAYIRLKSIIGLGAAEDFAEGAEAPKDDYAPLFIKNFYPERIGKLLEWSDDFAYSELFGLIAGLSPQIAKSFMLKQNLIAASLDNLGFTDTTRGIVSGETLYMSNHSNNGNAGSNVSSTGTNLAFGPQAVEQMKSDMRNQVSARGDIMPNDGSIIVKVPVALDGRAWAMARSDKLVGTPNNDAAYAQWKIQYETIPYYTSNTAWFARFADNDDHGLAMVHFKPYSIEQLAKDKRLMNCFIASQKLCALWHDFHGTWGTPGA